MDFNITQLGTISILYVEEDDDKSKKSDDKCPLKAKVIFDKETESVCIKALSGNDDSLSLKEKNTILKDEALYYCLYLRIEEQSRGYYYDEEKGRVILISRIDERNFIIHIGIINEDDGYELNDITDYHFDGTSAFRIEETLDEIKKEYSSDNKNKIAIAFFVLFFIILFLAYSVLFEEDVVPPPPPPPIQPPLNSVDIIKLKNLASLDEIENIKQMLSEMARDKTRNDGKQRIISYRHGKTTVLSPEPAIRRNNGTYYYKNEKLKKGALFVEFDKTYQLVYPKEGYVYSKNGLYVKNEKNTEKYYPDMIKNNSHKILNRKCLSLALKISPKDTFVYEREHALIRFKFKDVRASDFIVKASHILEECPAFLDEVSVSSGKFQGDLVLYSEERL